MFGSILSFVDEQPRKIIATLLCLILVGSVAGSLTILNLTSQLEAQSEIAEERLALETDRLNSINRLLEVQVIETKSILSVVEQSMQSLKEISFNFEEMPTDNIQQETLQLYISRLTELVDHLDENLAATKIFNEQFGQLQDVFVGGSVVDRGGWFWDLWYDYYYPFWLVLAQSLLIIALIVYGYRRKR